MVKELAVETAALSDAGQQRAENEDAYGLAEQRILDARLLARRGRLYVVCDGMGGHAAGERSSQLAVETVYERYYGGRPGHPRGRMIEAIRAANNQIIDEAEADEAKAGMGTTIVAGLIQRGRIYVFNVGDSRAYLLHTGELRLITKDHSWVGEQVRAGTINAEQARNHPYRSIITRALGNQRRIQSDTYTLPARPGDLLLLCSDGLWEAVSDTDIACILRQRADDPAVAASELVQAANANGGPDNITVVIVPVRNGVRRRWVWPALLLILLITIVVIAAVVWWQPDLAERLRLLVESLPPWDLVGR